MDETERNKDDIEHLEMLTKHYEERGAAYEVRLVHYFLFIFAQWALGS